LLVGGGLAMKSLYGLLQLDRGFQAERVLAAGLVLDGNRDLWGSFFSDKG
jgi:hypothetical protein